MADFKPAIACLVVTRLDPLRCAHAVSFSTRWLCGIGQQVLQSGSGTSRLRASVRECL